MLRILFITGVLLAYFSCALSADINITAVADQMIRLSKSSWEFGTAAEALLELYNPSLSVFGSSAFLCAAESTVALQYAMQHIQLGFDALIPGDGSSADPASLGVFAVMLAEKDSRYSLAVRAQTATLLTKTPRWWNGAISHRVNSAALW